MDEGDGRPVRPRSVPRRPPGRPMTAQETVLAELRRAIETRELEPGERIRQDDIAERLGVSRVPVREALKVLHAEGQVEYQPHRGYTARNLSRSDLDELHRMRALLEEEAIRQAVPRLDAPVLDELAQLAREMEQAGGRGDAARSVELNREFHLRLFRHAGLPRLYHHIEMLWQSSEPYRTVYFADARSRDRSNRDHRAILAALRVGDAESVVERMHRHRDRAIEELGGVLGDGEAAS